MDRVFGAFFVLAVVGALAAHAAAPPAPQGELVAAVVLHRHGDRSPVYITPATASFWASLGLNAGQLSSIGICQHQAFGEFLRSKYGFGGAEPLLPERYINTAIYVRSSDVDRTLMSVTALLSRLFPGATIPVHTINVDYERLLQPTDHCSSYVVARPRISRQFDQIALDTFGVAAIDQMYQITGYPKDKASPSALIGIIADSLTSEQTHNFSSSPFLLLRRAAMDTFHKKLMFAHNAMQGPTDPRGPVGNDLVNGMFARVADWADKVTGATPFSIFSAHDSTITALMLALGHITEDNSDYLYPPFASSVTFELRSVPGKGFHVNAVWGEPKPTGQPTDTQAGWSYQVQPLKLPCSALSDQCTIGDFAVWLGESAPNFGPTGGCCLRRSDFAAEGCDDFGRDFQSLNARCKNFRRLCPLASCGTDQMLNPATLNCVNMTTAAAPCPSKSGPTKTLDAVIGVMAVLIIVLMIQAAWLVSKLRKRDAAAQYGNLQGMA